MSENHSYTRCLIPSPRRGQQRPNLLQYRRLSGSAEADAGTDAQREPRAPCLVGILLECSPVTTSSSPLYPEGRY